MGERSKREEDLQDNKTLETKEVIEVPINLELINNKLNYLITKIDSIIKDK